MSQKPYNFFSINIMNIFHFCSSHRTWIRQQRNDCRSEFIRLSWLFCVLFRFRLLRDCRPRQLRTHYKINIITQFYNTNYDVKPHWHPHIYEITRKTFRVISQVAENEGCRRIVISPTLIKCSSLSNRDVWFRDFVSPGVLLLHVNYSIIVIALLISTRNLLVWSFSGRVTVRLMNLSLS